MRSEKSERLADIWTVILWPHFRHQQQYHCAWFDTVCVIRHARKAGRVRQSHADADCCKNQRKCGRHFDKFDNYGEGS